MAENKTKSTKASVAAHIAAIADDAKRADARTLVGMMQAASGQKPVMWGPSIIGFGSHHYKHDSGREGDMPVVAFSPRKAATVVYGAIGFAGADKLLSRLGKHTTGRGCLYIKRLSDIDASVLKALLVRSVASKQQKAAPKARG